VGWAENERQTARKGAQVAANEGIPDLGQAAAQNLSSPRCGRRMAGWDMGPPIDGMNHVKVVEDVLDGRVLGQATQESLDSLFRCHRRSLTQGTWSE
jgi:hypothetical protein